MGVHTLALAAAWLNPLDPVLRFALSLAIAWSLWRFLKFNPNTGVIGLRLLPDSGWRLTLLGGSETDARLLGSSVSNPWFVLLHLRSEHAKRFNLLICRDSLEPEAFRRLRVALRVTGLEDGQP